MKQVQLIFILALLATSYVARAINSYTFAPHSLLRSGRWIKLETEEEGIYEISYADLKNMGFSNPSAVCVYGEGGTPRPLSLTSENTRLVEDNPVQIPVMHRNEKIYFYGRGIRKLLFNGERFIYKARNIYNRKGHYYLSDIGTPMTMQSLDVTSEDRNAATVRTDGMGYVIYDDDRRMGNNRAGQQFWNLQFNESPGRSFNFKGRLPGKKANGKYYLEASIPYISNPNNHKEVAFRVTYNGTANSLKPDKTASHVIDYIMSGTLSGSLQDNIEVSAISEEAGNSYLDYWLMSYAKEPGASSAEQDILAYPATGISTIGVTAIKIPTGFIALDISDPASPKQLTTTGGKAYIPTSQKPHTLIIFNPSKSQYQVTGPVEVPSTDLHAYSTAGIGLLIITVPEAREYAEKIADLHRLHDGIGVLVTEQQRIFDEFGDGNQDPLAIRMLCKMLRTTGTASLKNILFIGPLRSDVRNILGSSQPDNFIIGFQEDIPLEADRMPALTFDYFGMTGDNVDASRLHTEVMDVGVGWLPIEDDKTGIRVVAKIEEYLKKLDTGDMASVVNEFMAFSHGGDNHVHDDEIKNWSRKMDSYFALGKLGRVPLSTLYQDLFGNDYTRAISNRLNDGKLLSVYIGHTRPESFGQIKSLYSARDFNDLKNPVPSFLYISGCNGIRPDFGETGIGILPVIHSPRALAGAVASSRSTVSGSNADLANYFFESFIMDDTFTSCNENPITAGEAFAKMKTRSTNYNEISYLYIGDPALTVPVPLRKAECSIVNTHPDGFHPGEIVVIEGSLLNRKGQRDTSAEGKIIAKLMAPSQSLTFPGSSPAYKGAIGDIRLTAISGTVMEGGFRLRVPLPEETVRHLSTTGPTLSSIPLFLSAYDPETHLAYSGYILIPMGRAGAAVTPSPADEPDRVAPVVNLSFNQIARSLSINITDNTGFMAHSDQGGGIDLYIDDVKIAIATDNQDNIAVNNKTVTFYPAHLTPGKHNARVSVVDLCGNRSVENRLSFIIPETPAKIKLTATTEYATDAIQFTISGPVDTDVELYILDSEGREIYSEPVSGTVITWSRNDTYSGNGAPAGSYKAGIRSRNAAVVSSGYKDFVILD